MEKGDKIKIQIDRDVANKLKSITEVGKTYSDTIRKLLDSLDGE